MKVELLGRVRVDGEVDALTRRDRITLTVLALHPEGPVSVDAIADALWGEDQPASHVKIVQGCISRLRKRLGHTAIATEGDGYRLVVPPDEVDVHRLERLVGRGRHLLELGEPDAAAHVLGEALSLWADPRLGDLDDWDRGRVERERLLGLHATAEELRVDALLRAGRPHEALPDALGLVEREPLHEARWVLLARAQYQCGRQVDALATIDRAQDELARELGLDAGPALQTLRDQILRHDPALEVADGPDQDGTRCPYPGLAPFEEEDADDLFGRDAEIDQCLSRLERDGVLVVVGPSGCGKSSLVRAGLAARCRRDGRSVGIVLTSPRLAGALDLGPSRPDVLVVDQLEALAGPDVTASQRRLALERVVEHTHRGWVVLVVRADRVGDFVAGPIAALLERHLLLLGPLDGDGLRRAIVGPAERAGLLLEPGLVDLLLHEVEDEPGALPLLAHALRATWQRREGRTLTVAGYHDAGGVRGAIARTAESMYEQLGQRSRQQLRSLLLRMAVRTADDTIVAAPVPLHTAEERVGTRVVEQLVGARLLTVDGDRVRVAHEALTRAWPRLQLWLDDDVAGQRILRHLTVAAEAWRDLGRPDSELYRGVRLEQAQDWRERTTPQLTPVEADFLDTAAAARRRRAAEVVARAERSRRTNHRLRRLLAAVATLSLVAVLAGAVAATSAATARDEALAADARRVGGQALLTDRVDQSLLLAAAAVDLDDSPGTRASLLTALGRTPQLAHVLVPGDGGALTSVAVSTDGAVVAVDEVAAGVRYLDARTGEELALVHDGDGPVSATLAVPGRAAFRPGGGLVAHASNGAGLAADLAGDDGDELPLVLLDAATLEVVDRPSVTFPTSPNVVKPLALAWSPDGTSLAAVLQWYTNDAHRAAGAVLAVWDVTDDGATTARTTPVPLHSRSLGWAADGAALVTAVDPDVLGDEQAPTVTVWDAPTLTATSTIPSVGHPADVSPDGTMLAAVGVDGGQPPPVVLVDLETGSTVRDLDGHQDLVQALRFSPDGTIVATASGRSTTLWDVATGQAIEQFAGHSGVVTDVAFAPDNHTLVTVGADGAGLAWDLTGTRRLLEVRARATTQVTLEPLALLPVHASIAPDGDAVVYLGARVREVFGDLMAGIQVLDVTTGRLSAARVVGPGLWQTIVWERDGTPVTLNTAGQLSRWDPTTGERVGRAYLQSTGSLQTLVDGDLVLLTEPPSAVLWTELDGPTRLDVRGLLLSTVDETADLEFAQLSLRPLAVAPDGDRVAAFAGSAAEYPATPTLARVIWPITFDALPASDHLVVIGDDDPLEVRATPIGIDGAAAAFSHSGGRIAVGGRLGAVVLVDADEMEPLGQPATGRGGAIRSVAWSADDTVVATGGEDGHVALWDGRTGASLGSIAVAPPGTIPYVAPGDDHSILIATTDGDVFSIDTRLEAWIDAACRIAGGPLDEAAWSRVAGGRPLPATCRT